MRDAKAQYRKAKAVHAADPHQRQMSALLGMGFLLGAEMYGAAEAMTSLYVGTYGWDALPDMVKDLERDE